MAPERKVKPPADFPRSWSECARVEAQMPDFVLAVWRDLKQEGVNLPRRIVVWGNDWLQQFEVWEANSRLGFNSWSMMRRARTYRLANLVEDRRDRMTLKRLTVIDVADTDPIGPEELTGSKVFNWGSKGVLATRPIEVYVVDGRRD